MKIFIALLAAFLWMNPAFAEPVFDMPPQVEVKNYHPPSPVNARDGYHLCYELHLTNFGNKDQRLASIDVLDAKTGKVVAHFDEEALGKILQEMGAKRIDDPGFKAGEPVLRPGIRTVAFLWLDFDDASEIPASLSHTLTFWPEKEGVQSKQITIPEIPVVPVSYAVLSRPFSGGGWYAGNGPSNVSGHRRACLISNGQPYIGQRFAIDWVKIGENGATFKGDPRKNESYFAHGADVFAVADGSVVKVLDGIPENTPDDGNSRAEVMTVKNIGGNQVAIDLGGGQYALYAHLIPGSITVKVGDTVKAGQAIAKLGNSGNSTEAHLHLQVSDKPDFLASEGVPYVFRQASVRKTKPDTNPTSIGPIETTDEPATQISEQLVLNEDLVDFG